MKKTALSIFLIFLFSFLLNVSVEALPYTLTVYIEVHMIQKRDEIESMLEDGADWYWTIYVWDGDKWLNQTSDVISDNDNPVPDITFSFQINLANTSFIICLFESDLSGYETADISESGPYYDSNYDLKTNTLSGEKAVVDGDCYRVSGDFDGSVTTDENDANLWFRIWDNYSLPVADAGPDKTVYKGDPVIFNGSNSQGSSIVKYEWDFDNDGVYDAEGTIANHIYLKKGTYAVTLRVTDGIGITNTDTCIVTVENRLPTASFNHSPSAPTIQDNISFHDTSADLDGSIVSYLWDFGDTYTSSTQNPTHKYTKSGTYTVTLTITDDDGASDTKTVSITVRDLYLWEQSWFYPLLLVCGLLISGSFVVISRRKR